MPAKHVMLMGWVNRRRDHGNLIFLDLRDRNGITQMVLDKEISPEGHPKAEHVRPEYVVAAKGKVRLRDADAINPKMATGEIEIAANELLVLNDSSVPPFSPAEDAIAERRGAAASIAISTCAGRRCRQTSHCVIASRSPFATTSQRRDSSKSRRRS